LARASRSRPAQHRRSRRSAGPFLRVNCGAIPPELADSELFGHERGSFTGASAQRKGWFERADGGTLFLDEVGELSPAVQVRLLRILQDGTFQRVGGQRQLRVDVRVVAALDQLVPGHIESALAKCLGRIEGPFGAARRLGVNPHTLRARMRRLGIDWRRFRPARHEASA